MKPKSLLILLLLIITISYLMVSINNVNITSITNNSFLFTYFGIFLGFALTIYTFLVSMIDKVRERVEKSKKLTKDKREKIEKNISKMHKDITQDIKFIFYSLIVVIIIILFSNVDLPLLKNSIYISKIIIIDTIKLSIFILSLLAIYDLSSASFKISNISGKFNI